MRWVRTRIKICGVTRPEDALAAAEAGADAIGLVFHAASPRAVDAAMAGRIIDRLPPLVAAVGLFMDAPRSRVVAVLDQVPLDLLQFHGNEPADYCESFHRRYIKYIIDRKSVV